ncbi:unnamed protein product, partial [Allacma fusca]
TRSRTKQVPTNAESSNLRDKNAPDGLDNPRNKKKRKKTLNFIHLEMLESFERAYFVKAFTKYQPKAKLSNFKVASAVKKQQRCFKIGNSTCWKSWMDAEEPSYSTSWKLRVHRSGAEGPYRPLSDWPIFGFNDPASPMSTLFNGSGAYVPVGDAPAAST